MTCHGLLDLSRRPKTWPLLGGAALRHAALRSGPRECDGVRPRQGPPLGAGIHPADGTLSPGREPSKTNGAAIASLILGILGLLLAVLIVGLPLALIAVILGFIALSSIGKSQQTATPQSGKGMAVAGLVTGGLGLVMGAVLVVAIAIPTYLNERNEALSAAVQADLRNAAVAEETYFTTNQTYTVNLDNLQSLGFVPSPGTTIRIVTAGPSSYCMEGSASDSATFRYDSSSGLAEGTC